MKLTRAQQEAKLRKAADALIERLLAWEEENRSPNLTQIEDKVLELRKWFGQELVAVMLAGQEAQQPVAKQKCEQCGAEVRYKGQKERSVESRVGGLTIERGHYYCACCQSGVFPPGQATWVGGEHTE